MSRLAILGVTVLVALAIACDKKEEPAAKDAAAAVSATAATGSAAPQGATAAGDEPSEEDFEEEAEKTITSANLEAEIIKMEADLR